MNRVTLTPVIRGAYLELGVAPVILLFDEDERPGLPALELTLPGAAWQGHGSSPAYTSDIRRQEKRVGEQARKALATLKAKDGTLPAALRVPGVGSFFAGGDYTAAERAQKGEESRILPPVSEHEFDTVRGRIALVTGGAQGFGAEMARGLVNHGAFVVVADINLKGAQGIADELNATGTRRARAVAVDVSDELSVKKMIDTVVREVGGLDLLVSNAGVLRSGSVLELSAEDFDFVTRINYNAFFLVTKQCTPVMIRQHAGAPSWIADIVQINSKSGLEGSNRNGAYAGGKFGGIGLVESFAMELVEYGIKVNAICPGNFFEGPLWSDPHRGLFVQYLRSGKVPGAKNIEEVRKFYEAKVPMGRGCEGRDVLKALLYCVEQRYETGQAVPVTGGQVMLR